MRTLDIKLFKNDYMIDPIERVLHNFGFQLILVSGRLFDYVITTGADLGNDINNFSLYLVVPEINKQHKIIEIDKKDISTVRVKNFSFSGQVDCIKEIKIEDNLIELEDKIADLLETKTSLMIYKHFLSTINLQKDYNPELDIPTETLERVFERFDWKESDGIILVDADDDPKYSIKLSNILELIEFLNNEIIEAMNGEMPLHWLKEQEVLDYEYEVREFLDENYKDRIVKLGWDYSEL